MSVNNTPGRFVQDLVDCGTLVNIVPEDWKFQPGDKIVVTRQQMIEKFDSPAQFMQFANIVTKHADRCGLQWVYEYSARDDTLTFTFT